MTAALSRPEILVMINAWLEGRELHGLDPAFRATITKLKTDEAVSAHSIEELHQILGDLLIEAGLVADPRDER